jgi:hypothetical protein
MRVLVPRVAAYGMVLGLMALYFVVGKQRHKPKHEA